MTWRTVFSWDPEESYQDKRKREEKSSEDYIKSLATRQAKARFAQLVNEFKQMYQIDTPVEIMPPNDRDPLQARFEQVSVYSGAEGSGSMWEVTKCLNTADAQAIVAALETHSADGKLNSHMHFTIRPSTGGSYLDVRRLCDFLHKDYETTRNWVFEDAPEKRWIR